MKCQQARTYLSPYLDSELGPTTTYEVSRHLAGCPACAAHFAAEEALERSIQARLARPDGDEEHVIERALSRVLVERAPFSGQRFAVAAAVLLLVLGSLAVRFVSFDTNAVPALVAMAADDHRRYLAGNLQPELATADPAALLTFFDGKLAGAVGAFPAGEDWRVEGARLCHIRGLPVGFVTLRYRGTAVSVVDVPEESLPRAKALGLVALGEHDYELAGGRGRIALTASGLRVAFGDVEVNQLAEVLTAAGADPNPERQLE